MRSASSRFRLALNASLRTAAALIVAVVPPLILGRLLHAEGPIVLLAVWSSSVVIFAAFAAGLGGPGLSHKRGAAAAAATFLAVTAGCLGAAVALVQLNVARRSLAEAWLELARMGEAFGFFSFFAAELCALFCIGSSLLFLARRPLSAIVALVASLSFTSGVILGDARFLALSLLAGAAVPLAAARGRPGQKIWVRLRSLLPPAAVALLVSLPFAFFEQFAASGPLIRPIDLTPIVRDAVPAFPLLLDVPGYGFQIDGSRLAPSVYLSDGVLFNVEGDGEGLRYIVSSVYSDWVEGSWRETQDAGRKIDVDRFSGQQPRPAGALRLRLAEDFYSVVPVERTTSSISLSLDAPKVETATRNRGLRFVGSGRRGFIADLKGPGAEYGVADGEDAPGGRWLNPGVDPSLRLRALAGDLARRGEDDAKEKGEDRDRAVIDSILAHFKTGYTYALKVRDGRDGEVAIERFIFDDKKGYCLHYATAFVLLARRAGISARVVEGFRVSLGERGLGTVRGVDAHAWAEAWVDGAWRVFEPTPPFAASDPFAYLNPGDSAARRQLQTVFGRSSTIVAEHRNSKNVLPILLVVAFSLAALVVILLTVSRLFRSSLGTSDVRAARRTASRLVERSGKLGIAGPEVLGWTGWATAVGDFLAEQGSDTDVKRRRKLRRIRELYGAETASQAMLRIAFDSRSDR